MIYVIDFFAAIEDKAKPRFMTDLASLNAEHLRQICFLIKTLPHSQIPNYQFSNRRFNVVNSQLSIPNPPPYRSIMTICQHIIFGNIIASNNLRLVIFLSKS